MLSWCQERSITLTGEFLPGAENELADALSRGGPQSAPERRLRGSSVEWFLHPEVCHSIFTRLDRPHIDLFASRLNRQLPNYFSWGAEAESMGRNALTQEWSGLLVYAFPPISLIPRVLLKLSQTTACRMLLVAPSWPRQVWFSRLLGVLVAEPVRLPDRLDLLSISGTSELVPPQTVQALRLTVWTISADRSLRRAFLERLPVSHCRQGDRLLEEYILRDSEGLLSGVGGSRVTPILHL